MATTVTPFAHYSGYAIQQSRGTPQTPINLHFQSGKWRPLTKIVRESENVSKITETQQKNDGSFADRSVADSGVWKNAATLLYSMDFTNPDECCETYAVILRKCRKFGNLELGLQVHTHLIVCGVELCDFLGSQLLELYCKLGCVEDACNLFHKMPERNVLAGRWKNVYDYMLRIGFEGNAYVRRSFLEMFIKCGRIDIAKRLFEEMKFKDIFMWNMMVSGYASKGDFRKAWRCIREMKLYGVVPDQVTWNSVIAGYAQKGQVDEAFKYISQLSDSEDYKLNVVSWTSLITGHEHNGNSSEALLLFRKMLIQGVPPNSVTIASVISSCTYLSLCLPGKEIHGYCVKRDELDSDLLVINSLVDFYAKCWSLKVACRKFNEIKEKDLVSWNTMLSGYASGGYYKEAIELLNEMEAQGVEPDIITWNGLITGCTKTGHGKTALEFLYRMFKMGIEPNLTSLSGALAACSQVKDLKLGKEIHGYGLSSKDVIIWNSIIAACSQSRLGVTALNLLRDMNLFNIKPDMVTMVSVLPACSRLAALYQGKEIHQFIIRHGLNTGNFVWNALIDMYGRCGSIQKSRSIFDMMPHKDLVSWNVMISMYGMHGFGMEAISIFQHLIATGVKPNHFTFTNLLSACSHSGLVDEGWEYFQMMKTEHHMEPGIEQYACMVDLMARAGHFDESLEFIKEMPFEPNAAVWGSLLAGRWEDADKIRSLMKDRRVMKSPGCSWIEVKRKVHSFIVGDTSHPMMEEILLKMESLYVQIKKIGYVPDTDYVLQNVKEEEKEWSLCGHSEKLALTFGLISTPAGSPLRIIKNLRICGDCHTATKYISKVEGSEIITRDNYRFHHFVQGVCSCGDYW
ncbi:hypothetical protein FNV43_RR03557 [Rhamnella rubrinervis]|uniref:DYW domain-containing protein n=1 Tax=Rhamnella rubrinervis TaxID=2594499 RepID=A0A8K0HJD2_9ROSA|nr:hypothetical protein FNV43_RR03557 [Rhamnella rubrinervis]